MIYDVERIEKEEIQAFRFVPINMNLPEPEMAADDVLEDLREFLGEKLFDKYIRWVDDFGCLVYTFFNENDHPETWVELGTVWIVKSSLDSSVRILPDSRFCNEFQLLQEESYD